MRLISIVIALFVAGASGRHIHQIMPTPLAAGVDLVIFIIVYLVISRSIKAYLDE